jgi:hypothetical protein
MSIYSTPEERTLEWAYINALSVLKEHMESPPIDRIAEPNKKKRKALQHERGVKTNKLRAEMRTTHQNWRSWKLCNEPQNTCACGKNFKSHQSRDDPTKSVCYTCLLGEPTYQNELRANIGLV